MKNDKKDIFEKIYDQYWHQLYQYAYNILRERNICEEIVQETFLYLWKHLENLQITHSLQSYLFSIVRYQVLNFIKAKKVRTSYANSYAAFENTADNSNEENIYATDLKNHFEEAVATLPEKCQQIFRMSRNDHHSIKHISSVLNLSHKTVENQISKALKHLRTSLGDFLLLMLIPALSFQIILETFLLD